MSPAWLKLGPLDSEAGALTIKSQGLYKVKSLYPNLYTNDDKDIRILIHRMLKTLSRHFRKQYIMCHTPFISQASYFWTQWPGSFYCKSLDANSVRPVDL